MSEISLSARDGLQFLGTIVRLQVQLGSIKTGDGAAERYTPAENLQSVPALLLDDGGVQGISADGSLLPDVHHRDHPRSKFRGENGISIGFTGHYELMRERFGNHVTNGIAAENIFVRYDGQVSLAELAAGVVITGEDGRRIVLGKWGVAHPCSPFTRFCLQFPDGERADRRVTEALQFLDDGMRGYTTTPDPATMGDREVRIGDEVWIVQG